MTNINTGAHVSHEEVRELLQHEQAVRIVYTNYKGETSERTIIPRRMWLGETQWHPGTQWLLDAFDLDKQADRSFAVRDIHRIIQPAPTPTSTPVASPQNP